MNTNQKNLLSESKVSRKNCLEKIGWFAAIFLILSGFFHQPVQARSSSERYVLDLDDIQLRGHRGEPATIFLKRTLKEQFPGVRIADLDLKKVVLVAKTKKGYGRALLRVGQEWSEDISVSGSSRDFYDSSRYTFDRVKFRNPALGSEGPWQIKLRGNFVVRKIVLVVDNHAQRVTHHRPHFRRYWY